jgi:hypothetical protein
MADKATGRMVEDRSIAGISSTVEPQVFLAAWRPLTNWRWDDANDSRKHSFFDQWSDEGRLVDIRKPTCDQREIEEFGKKRSNLDSDLS